MISAYNLSRPSLNALRFGSRFVTCMHSTCIHELCSQPQLGLGLVRVAAYSISLLRSQLLEEALEVSQGFRHVVSKPEYHNVRGTGSEYIQDEGTIS